VEDQVDTGLLTGSRRQARQHLDVVCREAERLREEARRAAETLRAVRNELHAARLAQEEARAAADGRQIERRKRQAREAYRRALAAATDPTDRQKAAATWLHEIDLINRASRAAMGSLVECQARAIALEQQADSAQRAFDARRTRSEAADAACADASSDTAEAEQPEPRPTAAESVPVLGAGTRRTGRPAHAIPDQTSAARRPTPAPLRIEALLAGDHDTIRELARAMAEVTGSVPSRYLLLLKELVDVIVWSAADAGMLVFDHGHPFWAQFSPAESREITGILGDLGFRFDPHDGWYGQRVPALSDLALALVYAGFDVRGLRRLPVGAELRRLPESVTISSLEYLGSAAPDLDVDQITRLLGPRADRLGDLWDDWAQLRPMLLEASTPVPA
jgi:hypothetical protein